MSDDDVAVKDRSEDIEGKDKSKGPGNNLAERTLTNTERFYSAAIFVIFVLCITGIFVIYALAVGVLLGVILIIFHGLVQWYRRKKDNVNDVNQNIPVVDVPCEPCKVEDTPDDVCIDVGQDCKDTAPAYAGTRLASQRRSSLPSVTENEIALHFFHALGVITEVPAEELEDEGFGNEAFEIDMDDTVCCGSSSPPTYTDSRYIYSFKYQY